MFEVTPELFNDPNGFYIVCKSQEEVDACLKDLHNIGLLWRDGDLLTKPQEVTFNAKEDTAILIGNPPIFTAKITFVSYTVVYERVANFHEKNTWCLRAKRVLYKNCTFHPAGRQPASEVSYDDEN